MEQHGAPTFSQKFNYVDGCEIFWLGAWSLGHFGPSDTTPRFRMAIDTGTVNVFQPTNNAIFPIFTCESP